MMNEDSEQAQQQQQQVTFAEGVAAAAAPQDLITPTNGSTNGSMASSTNGHLHDKKKSTLSVVSKQYDRTNKGYLDETEQAMRQLDESGRGHVPNHVVYDLMQESVTMHKKMATQRHLLIALGCFTVILALANMATAFAAASLAKVCIIYALLCAVTIFYFPLCVETYVLCWND